VIKKCGLTENGILGPFLFTPGNFPGTQGLVKNREVYAPQLGKNSCMKGMSVYVKNM